jgi:MSHA biogenesis protein MshL
MNRKQERLLGAVAAVLLAACASDPAAERPAVPKEVADALLPPPGYGGSAPAPDPAQQRFDVNVRAVPAQTFFASLAENTPYNLAVQPGVSGSLTLNLKNVTLPEVMDYVREAYGYDYLKTPSGYTVLAETMQSRIFRVNYLNVKRTGKSRISVSSGQLTDHRAPGSAGAALATGGSDLARGAVASSGIETESASDFWTEIEATLKLLMPEGSGRKLVINRDAGLIVARALTSELRGMENYLRSLQASLTRQVILEAKILEVQLNESFQAGINWAALGTNRDGYTSFGAQIGGANVFDSGVSSAAGTPITINPSTGAVTVPSLPTTAIGGAVTAVLSINDFAAVIELLQGQGDVKVLSSPRVSTVNNQKAIIKVGSDEFFVTGVRSDTTTGAATTTNRTVEFTPFFSGIALDVTPQIDEQNVVTLHVHPTVSDVRDGRKDVTLGGQTESFPLALSNVREADSIVRARSGQIIVIGGLMQETDRDDRFGVPLLSRLPLIGFLFRQTRVLSQKSELVILLKPVVVESDEQWAQEVRRRELRVEEIQDDQRSWWN